MEKVKLVIFDMDGTLFRTETVDVAAFNRALAANGYKTRTEKEILDLIGHPFDVISQLLLDTKDNELHDKFMKDLINFEEEEIQKHGKLYDGVEEFLKRLNDKGYTLCLCSNGNEEYVMSIATKFSFDRYFKEIWYKVPGVTKSDAIKSIKEKYNAQTVVVIGDRSHDIEACRDNQGISIGVTYGFGGDEVLEADYTADTLAEIETILEKVFND